jgi:hypothetical protein
VVHFPIVIVGPFLWTRQTSGIFPGAPTPTVVVVAILIAIRAERMISSG